VPPAQLALIRVFAQMLVVTVTMGFSKIRLLPPNRLVWKYVFGRGLSGGCAMLLSVFTAVLLPLGDSQALQDMYPVACALLAYVWLREPLPRTISVALVLSVAGTILIAQPSFLFGGSKGSGQITGVTSQYVSFAFGTIFWAPDVSIQPNLPSAAPMSREFTSMLASSAGGAGAETIGFVFGVGTSLAMAIAFIMVRKAKEAHTLQLVFWLNICQALGAIVVSLSTPGQAFVAPSLHGWIMIAIMTALNLLYILSCTFGAQMIPVALSSILMSTDIVWAYCFEVVLFGQSPSVLTLCGVACVLLGVTALTLEKMCAPGTEASEPQACPSGEISRMTSISLVASVVEVDVQRQIT